MNDLNMADKFRLERIEEIERRLKKERDFRAELYEKYQRGVNIITIIDTTLITAGLIFGVGGIFAGPVLVAIETTAGVCNALGIVCKLISKKLQTKANKHDEIRVLAESKINTISTLISKAISDNTISDEEFDLIISELNKFYVLKTNLKSQHKLTDK